jgi:hypothetical protein
MRPDRVTATLLTVIVLVAALPARAQTVAGLVRDSSSGRPAQHVEVQVRDTAGAVLVTTETDTTGVFYALLSTSARIRLHFAVGGVAAFDSGIMTVGENDFVQHEYLLAIPRVYFEFQVEKQVSQVPGTGSIRYPEELKQRNVQGEVLAQFVVDTTGLAMMETFKVLFATDKGFIPAVRRGLATVRFLPAEVNGRKVKQMVQQPFTFALTPDAGPPAAPWFPFEPPTRGRP